MSLVIFKDRVELSAIFPDLTNVDDYQQFLSDNSSLTFTVDDQFVDIPWDISTNDIVMVVGVNQQTKKRYIAEYIEGGTTEYGTDWDEGYYKIYVRKYKRPTNSEEYVNLIDSNDFFELTNKELFWNKSILSFMVYLQPGSYTMGSPLTEIGRNPDEVQHKVTLTEGFYIGRTVLTNGMFNAIMSGITPESDVTSINVGGQTKSTCFSLASSYWRWYKEDGKSDDFGRVYISYAKYQSDKSSRDGEYSGFGQCTINNQTTYYPYPYLFNINLPDGEADKSFITTINTNLPITDYKWDLPTEAQWEYACRGSTKSAFNNGENLKDNTKETETFYVAQPNINEICWYKMHDGQRHECAMLRCNQWGLFDMHGNNWEWTKDYDNGQVFSNEPVTDPYESVYIPSGEGIYGEYSDAKIIRGGWAGWTAKACRSAYRYEDYISAVAPSFGTRLVLRKDVIDITISPKDITDVCEDATVTTESCEYTLSRPLIGDLSDNTVNVTYNITNNTISITTASITYTGPENYSYNVTIGSTARVVRTPKTYYTLSLTPVFTGRICMEDSSTYPTSQSVGYSVTGYLQGNDNVVATCSVEQSGSDFTCSISNYTVNKVEDGCYGYTVETNSVVLTGESCKQTYDVELIPTNIEGICGDKTVDENDCGYIVSGILIPSDTITNLTYSIDNVNNTYSISHAEIVSSSNAYDYNLTYPTTATISRVQKENVSCSITPVVSLKDANEPLYKDDTLETLQSKINTLWTVGGFKNGDGAIGVTFTYVKNTDSLSITVNTYTIAYASENSGLCYEYNVSTPTVNMQLVENTPEPQVYDITISPKVDGQICPVGYTPTTSDCGYEITVGGLVDGDNVIPEYNISGLAFNLTSNTTITSQSADYSYNITVDTSSKNFNTLSYETKSITVRPKLKESGSLILLSDQSTWPTDNSFYCSLVAGSIEPGDYITNITYSITSPSGSNNESGSNNSGSNDSGSVFTCTITGVEVAKPNGGCYTYSINTQPYYIHPVTITPEFNNESICSTTEAVDTDFTFIFTGLNSGDTLYNMEYIINNTDHTVTSSVSNNTRIESDHFDDYWYAIVTGSTGFSTDIIDPTIPDNTVNIVVTPTLDMGENAGTLLNDTLLTTNTISEIVIKINNKAGSKSYIYNSGAIFNGDTISLNNITYSFAKNENVPNELICTMSADISYTSVNCKSYTLTINPSIYYLYYPVTVTADNVSVCKDIDVDNNTVGIGFTATGTSANNIENVVYDFTNANTNKGTTTSDSYTITSYSVKDTQNKYYKQIGNAGVITRTNCESTPTLTISIDTSCICDPDGISSETDIIDESNEPGVVTTTFTGLSGGDSVATPLTFDTTATIQTTNN